MCDAELLLCDEDANACVSCTEHEQCASGACELAVGRCFPEDVVVHVDQDGGQDFSSVTVAVGSIGDGMAGVIVVHEAGMDGLTAYQGLVQVDGGKTIALLAAAGEAPILQGTGVNPGVRAQDAETTLYVDGIGISGNAGGVGLEVDGATAGVDRSRIDDNNGGGVQAQSMANLTLRNCFVGGIAADVDAIALNEADLTMLYTTVGGGSVVSGRTRALFCDGASVASVRNSILVSLDTMSEVECPTVTLTTSATEAEVGFSAAWFDGYAAGEFSLSASGMTTFEGLAQWQAGDPATDIDGDARPDVDGTADYAGADVP
ncbi:MAG: hypothetical protein AB1Z98_28920 [Nannocystaceae bacterium]